MGSEGNLGSSGALRWSWNHQGMWGTPRALQILRWPWDPHGSWRDSRPIVETLMGTKDGGRTGIFDRPAFVLQPTLASDRGEIRIY